MLDGRAERQQYLTSLKMRDEMKGSDTVVQRRRRERTRGKTCATTVGINSTAFLHTRKSGHTNLHLRVARARVCAHGGVCVRARSKEYVYDWDCFMRASDKIASLTDANTCANYEKQLLSHVWEDYWSMLIWLKCINNFTLFLGGICRMKCSCCQSSAHTRAHK